MISTLQNSVLGLRPNTVLFPDFFEKPDKREETPSRHSDLASVPQMGLTLISDPNSTLFSSHVPAVFPKPFPYSDRANRVKWPA